MDGDASIRWIWNKGSAVAQKPVKTAEERHGGGHKEEGSGRSHYTLERTAAVEACGPATMVEGTATVAMS
jgi:hypothetical protein